MYRLKCDDFILYDPLDDDLIVENPVVKLETNTVGECTFTIFNNHPYYGQLKPMKSVFEVTDDIGVIFRGRMTNNSRDFYNSKLVDVEGAMAYFNDSTVRPYSFPEDYANNAGYIAAAESGNVVAFFLDTMIQQHNEQVDSFQRFKLGNVTVADPNNYISRADSSYPTTWETLKGKLFDSALGGYLCIRYEPDGNYIDYLSEFELTNTQEIVFGENLLDLTSESDFSTTYSAIIPIGATDEETKTTLTISSIADGDITSDIVKAGDMLYSKSAREAYGLICAPVKETTWDDVTVASNLVSKGSEWLSAQGMKMAETIEVSAVDLHFTDEQIQTFRINRNVKVQSIPHNYSGVYQLSKLEIPLQHPENTKITVGATKLTLIETNNKNQSSTIERVESIEKDISNDRSEIANVKNQLITQSTEFINTCNSIVASALTDYVETSDYETFRQTITSQLTLLSEQMTLKFTQTTQQIDNVNSDLQEKYNTITKYFTFDINGLTIGQIDNPNKIVIDNDDLTIYVNNVPIQEFKSDGTALIPSLKITLALNLLGLQITDDGNTINCDYVGV